MIQSLKVLVAAGLLLVGAATAQQPWQHTLTPAFPEPFDMLELPWDVQVESRDITACWPEENVPYYGVGVLFWCFEVHGAPIFDLGQAISRALPEAGHQMFLISSSSTQGTYQYSPLTGPDDLVVAYWVFRQDGDSALVAFATHPDAVPLPVPAD